MAGPTETFEAMPKSASAICTVNNEDSIKREDTMARHPNYESRHQNYESLAVATPVVAARKSDLTASNLSPQNQHTPIYSSANTLKGDQVLIGENTNRKVVMQ